MLYVTMIKAQAGIDCLGKEFYCTALNAYLPCWYDEDRDTTVTVTDRSDTCSSGALCDEGNDEPCVNSNILLCFVQKM